MMIKVQENPHLGKIASGPCNYSFPVRKRVDAAIPNAMSLDSDEWGKQLRCMYLLAKAMARSEESWSGARGRRSSWLSPAGSAGFLYGERQNRPAA